MDGMRIGNYALDTELMMEWGEMIGKALLILLITWVVAKAAKWAFAKLVDKVGFLQRDTSSGDSIGMSLGKIVSLLIWLIGLIAVLNVFGLTEVIKPIDTLLDTTFGVVPGIVGGGVILFLGIIVARIVKQIVQTILETANVDGLASKAGVGEVTGEDTSGKTSISRMIAIIASVFVVIPFAIAALDVIGIDAITGPATAMLQTVLDTIPNIFAAVIVLGIFYFIAKWVAGLVEDILPSLGLDNSVEALGIVPAGTKASSVISKVALIAITLFGAIEATRLLKFEALTSILDTVISTGGNVLWGAVLILAGVLLARILSNLVTSSTGDSGFIQLVVKYAIIGLFVAIGLNQMGIGGPIVEYAFGALMVGVAIAAALAFGLGGREAASKMLEDMRKK